ncbi:Protein HemY [Sinobacterium norvegicum]|uniref:Protein HemY n=1 Tax=Sinobacterium norvegicum TaxID=1641715 RepID=A0ABN8EHF7_9GAMM|nr:heme biosynthesis HemY N-terminal domain-containing protein [Sinobacterium norvegicum]CAH0991814.1 Protein HemY [Sinobacterium norvegicum]
MRAILITVLIALVIAFGIAWGIHNYPGYVLVAVGKTTIEMTLWVAAFIFLLAAISGLLTIWLIARSLRLPFATRNWLTGFGSRNANALYNRGLIAFSEGHWEKSRKALERAAKRSDHNLVHYLVAARASYRLNDEKSVEKFLQLAYVSAPNAHATIEITQAEMQLAAKHYEQSLATILRLRKKLGKQHPFVLELLVKTYRGLKDYRHLEKLLVEVERSSGFTAEQYEALAIEVYQQRLQAVAKMPDAVSGLQEQWAKLNKKQKNTAELLLSYSALLGEVGAAEVAVNELQRYLRKYWDDEAVELYGRLKSADLQKQLLFAEGWLKERNNNPVLLLSLARICMRLELWGKAREYYETSLRFTRNNEAYLELAQLSAALGDEDKSKEYYRLSFNLEQQGLALPMPSKPLR